MHQLWNKGAASGDTAEMLSIAARAEEEEISGGLEGA
jgi:phosphoribosyl-AMP cyclohydrolase